MRENRWVSQMLMFGSGIRGEDASQPFAHEDPSSSGDPQDAPALVLSLRPAGGRREPTPPRRQPHCGPCHQVVLCQDFPSTGRIQNHASTGKERRARSNLMDKGVTLDPVTFCLGHPSLQVS